jgi:hypothetical protein
MFLDCEAKSYYDAVPYNLLASLLTTLHTVFSLGKKGNDDKKLMCQVFRRIENSRAIAPTLTQSQKSTSLEHLHIQS